MKNKPEIISRRNISCGNWINLGIIDYRDSRSETRSWEYVSRNKCSGAVAVIAVTKQTNSLILIKQYRPPAEKYTIEFPAGLIENGDSAEETAIRELYEETGYIGKIKKITPPAYSSPGLTSETISLAVMEIDEYSEENRNPVQHLEESEDIEVLNIKISDLGEFIERSVKSGCGIDAKIMTFLQAQQLLT